MFRHIRAGRVSATLSHSGEKQIEITELLRAFGELQPETATPATPSDRLVQSQSYSATHATATYQIELERLKAQLELKSAELDLAKERIAELKNRERESASEKNRLLSLIEQQTRLLTAPVPVKRAKAPMNLPAPIPTITRKRTSATDTQKQTTSVKKKASKTSKKLDKKSK